MSELLKSRQDLVNLILDKYLPAKNQPYNQEVIDAMAYSLAVGGKRLRPIFLAESFQLFKSYHKKVEPFMAAIEFIHTYSLIHDDLPAMDNDALRRGQPTCHIKYGEDLAILAGDGLLNSAYEVMIQACLDAQGDRGCLQAMAAIGRAAGVSGMIGGQVADVIAEKKEADLDTLTYIHQHKTAALIEASLVAGALIAHASEKEVEGLRHIGRCIGLAFQIQDDILDVVGDAKKLGKPIHSDEKNNKMTYVSLKGIDASKAVVDSLIEEALRLLQGYDEDKRQVLEDFIIFLKNREY